MTRMWIAAVVFALPIMTTAQEPGAGDVRQDPTERAALEKMVVAVREGQAGTLRSTLAVGTRITTGAPYSADQVTEITQTLADGNRINHRTTMRVYRDSEGRTRREELGENGEIASISIVDAVAHVSYALDPKTRTAFRGSFLVATPRTFERGIPPTEADKRATEAAARAKFEAGQARERIAAVVPPPPPPPPPAPTGMIPPPPPPPPPPPGMKVMNAGGADAVKEDLGRQNMEGVAATGTRTTWTIAAGAIGNLQPIKIVSEEWFSPDLQLLVLTKHNDPRTGETTYRLQNIVRAEPDRSLFVLPADYTVKESGIRKE